VVRGDNTSLQLPPSCCTSSIVRWVVGRGAGGGRTAPQIATSDGVKRAATGCSAPTFRSTPDRHTNMLSSRGAAPAADGTGVLPREPGRMVGLLSLAFGGEMNFGVRLAQNWVHAQNSAQNCPPPRNSIPPCEKKTRWLAGQLPWGPPPPLRSRSRVHCSPPTRVRLLDVMCVCV
jgi:hypothetical protein